jgi:phospholipase A2
LYNQTPRDLHIALYEQCTWIPFIDQSATRVTAIYSIESHQEIQIERPQIWWGNSLILLFVEDASLLTQTVSKAMVDTLNGLAVDSEQGTLFYIAVDGDDIYGYTASEWETNQGPLQEAEEALINALPAIKNNPYKNSFAFVRNGNGLVPAEYDQLTRRLAHVAAALAHSGIACPSQKIPRVALACSGGGYRAMLYATGALKAFIKNGTFDLVSYLVGLSGSTWAIASWISSGTSIDLFHEWLINHVYSQADGLSVSDAALIEEVLLTKYCSGQPLGFVDLYGACIANNLFGLFAQNKNNVHLSEQMAAIGDGSLPLPIYTAVSGEENQTETIWYEFTPYEVGAPRFAAYVPSWAFGRKFKNGLSVSNAPQQSMGTILGTFGLAIGSTVSQIFQDENLMNATQSALVHTILARIVHKYGNDRLVTAEYLNYLYQIAGIPRDTLPVLRLVDAGTAFNLPYPPISGLRPDRRADIIIFIDASAGTIGGELRNVENYARANNLPFPVIDYTDIDKHAVSVFSDDDSNVPTVIYVPIIVDHALLEAYKSDPAYAALYPILKDFDSEACINSGPCGTFNFSYTPQQARCVTALGEFNAGMACGALLTSFNQYLS